MNFLSKQCTLFILSGVHLCALNAAEIGLQVPQPKVERFGTSASLVYTPQNGYFGDLTLLASPGTSAVEASARRLVALLTGLIAEQKLVKARLSEIDASNGDVSEQREVLQRRQQAIERMLERVVSLIKERSPAKPPQSTKQ